MNHFSKDHFLKGLSNIIGEKNIITTEWGKLPFSKGWRYGEGEALAVAKPGTLFEIWQTIQVCIDMDIVIIMQAANTGLTGGSTPFGDDYDRPILIINTRRISNIHVLNEGKQIVSFAGSTLVGLEKKLAPYGREPHSVIGSSCIGASIVGGVCNNSGGALIKRGPAYTELALYAKIDTSGNLVLINDLGIELGENPKEILYNLQNQNYNQSQISTLINLHPTMNMKKEYEILKQIHHHALTQIEGVYMALQAVRARLLFSLYGWIPIQYQNVIECFI